MRGISGLAAILFLAVIWSAKAACAQPIADCNQGPVDVDVQLDYAAPHEDTTQTALQINSMFRQAAESTLAMDRKGIYVGVTYSPIRPALSGNFLWGGLSNVRQKVACPLVQKVTYTISYHPKVYIAADFLQMACRYGVTVMHEQRHVDAYLQTINEYMPLIKKAAEDYIAQMPPRDPVPLVQADIDARRQETMKAVGESLAPVIEQFKETNYQRQAAIDTPENYAHDSAICPGRFIPAFADR